MPRRAGPLMSDLVRRPKLHLGRYVMNRQLLLLLAVGVILTRVTWANDKPKPEAEDVVGTALSSAKMECHAAVKLAKEEMVAAFAEQKKKLEENTKLKVDVQIKLVEEIQAEKKAFEEDPAKLPKSAAMKNAVADFQKKLATAKKKSEAAFDTAADAYRRQQPPDLTSAKAVLTEKAKIVGVDAVVKNAAATKDAKGPPNPLATGVVLSGIGGPFPCTLEVTELKGDTIKGVWTWSKTPPDKDHVVPFVGKWTKDTLSVAATDGSKISMSGVAKGDKLVVRYKGPFISPTLEFSLVK